MQLGCEEEVYIRESNFTTFAVPTNPRTTFAHYYWTFIADEGVRMHEQNMTKTSTKHLF